MPAVFKEALCVVGRPEGNTKPGRPRLRLVDNIRRDVK
jgi:hypothetical protein